MRWVHKTETLVPVLDLLNLGEGDSNFSSKDLIAMSSLIAYTGNKDIGIINSV